MTDVVFGYLFVCLTYVNQVLTVNEVVTVLHEQQI